ncbi:hypothetical protein SELMODRAFT_93858 [Selaginella moellendorffii]|uniref:glutathione transferase n=1 Tax=Selaginella moellendorffii TaxID=88036 RepID=D8RGZ4_SELML|nr:probable glutathione S-transferase [Selaginella moellendorffii]EFJ28677.1 hypothetical protein SELMODRAFT_93858 [Selaginella moellendorffii]|eukprot:XP_002970547.1 probable glutathione S-transferase [Selaginella moellendorffii]
MADESVKLLCVWSSPYSMRAMLALELKSIPYERVEQDVRSKGELLLRSNPVHKKVPVLIHNGRPIAESSVIIEYIDEQWRDHGDEILPRDPYARAQERFWADFVERKIFAESANVVFRATGQEDFLASCGILEEELRKSNRAPYFGGAKLGLVDIVLVSTALCSKSLVEVGGLRLPSRDACPRFLALLDAIREHPLVRSSLPSPDKLRDFFATAMPWIKSLS